MIDPIEKSDLDIDQSPFEIEALAARYRAERDLAIQERERLEKEVGLLRDAEHERDMLRDLADVLVVKAIERPCVRTFAEGLDDAEINDRIDSIIDAIDRRLMPPGMEWLVEAWPRFEDGEPVDFGDEVAGDDGDARGVDKVVFYGDQWRLYDRYGCEINEDMMGPGERVRRPAPKVLDADGVEIRVGDVLYRKSDGHMVKVAEVYEKTFTDADDYVRPGDGYTHRVPVFAADVRPLHEGEHVYHVETGAELVVKGLPKPGEYQAVVVFAPPASHLTSFDPDQLTHERPESWERLEEDASKNPFDYCKDVGHRLDTCENSEAYKARDIVRRAKALAGVSE